MSSMKRKRNIVRIKATHETIDQLVIGARAFFVSTLQYWYCYLIIRKNRLSKPLLVLISWDIIGFLLHFKECQLCDQRKQPSTTPKVELVPSLELSPMQRIEIGVLGGLPMTHAGKRYILIACDTYTQYMQAWPMRSQTAQETGMTLYRNCFTAHGVPERIHSDQGGNFESMLFRELATPLGCKKTRTTA